MSLVVQGDHLALNTYIYDDDSQSGLYRPQEPQEPTLTKKQRARKTLMGVLFRRVVAKILALH